MNPPKIQLLVFQGCPLADAARASLRDAIATLGFDGFEEVDLLDANAPADLEGWGSPTILVDGKDVAGGSKGSGVGCRVYAGPDKVPTKDAIVRFVRGVST